MGRGLQEAKQLHHELQSAWRDFLSEQDAGGWRGHWTVQNKVAEEKVAADAFEEIQHGFGGAQGSAKGCSLWRYVKGSWEFERDVPFAKAGA